MADEIAKTDGKEVIAGFKKQSENTMNNQKAKVRPIERTAKFPKKISAKPGKKSGVKTKNYYNTKLSFSKDPRNPANMVKEGQDLPITDGTILTIDELEGLEELLQPAVREGVDVEKDVEGDIEGVIDSMEVSAIIDESSTEESLALADTDSSILSEKEESIEEDKIEEERTEEKIAETREEDEMEDVDVIEVIDPLIPLTDGGIKMSVANIEAVDLIRLSSLLNI
jgi:hypothetical protein